MSASLRYVSRGRVSPRQATYFLCFAKESKQRKATLLRRPPVGRVPCDARDLGPAPNSLRYAPLRQGARSQSMRFAALTVPSRCASRRLHKGPEA